jgi:hypothetical protein
VREQVIEPAVEAILILVGRLIAELQQMHSAVRRYQSSAM